MGAAATLPPGASAADWVELVESGETFTGYCSPDGKTWTKVGSTTLTSTISTAYVGLAVTSHNNSSSCTATFDNVTAPGWPLPPLVPTATAVSNDQVNVTWNPQTGATSYDVERSTTSGGPYTTIATGITSTSYTDTSVNLSSGAQYYYVVSAIVGGSQTAAGPQAAVGFPELTGNIIGTAGSYNNSGNTIANVFDGNLNTFFDGPTANGCWVGLDFGVGVSSVITQVNYCPRSGFESRMEGGVFQGEPVELQRCGHARHGDGATRHRRVHVGERHQYRGVSLRPLSFARQQLGQRGRAAVSWLSVFQRRSSARQPGSSPEPVP